MGCGKEVGAEMPKEVIIRLTPDKATDLKLWLIEENYHVPPRPDALLADRLVYEAVSEILKQLERQGVR
jgi:hypothetical protein